MNEWMSEGIIVMLMERGNGGEKRMGAFDLDCCFVGGVECFVWGCGVNWERHDFIGE